MRTIINPDDVLNTPGGRVWTPERNAEAWARSYEALEQALAHASRDVRVIVVCGVQGAGKTSWIASQAPTMPVIYFDAALPGARHRAPIVATARRHRNPIDAVWIDTPLEIAIERNARRAADTIVPLSSLLAVAKQFEAPAVSEGFDRVLTVTA